jgi:hypothetical protein
MEFFLLLWDDIDDAVCACRHLATETAGEVLSSATPLIATASVALIAGATTLLLAAQRYVPALAL